LGAIEGDVSGQLRQQMRDFQATIRRNGVRTVRGPGALRHDCPPNQVVVEARKDCFVYRLEGRRAVLLAGMRRPGPLPALGCAPGRNLASHQLRLRSPAVDEVTGFLTRREAAGVARRRSGKRSARRRSR
jgi:hypothetical protein